MGLPGGMGGSEAKTEEANVSGPVYALPENKNALKESSSKDARL